MSDIGTMLQKIAEVLKVLQPQTPPGPAPTPSGQPEDYQTIANVLKIILGEKGLPLGQVNGALGETIGNLLNGKKTALGILGTVVTQMLSTTADTGGLGAIVLKAAPAALAGMSGYAMPIFLGLAAWGVLGKFEKWAQGTVPVAKS